MGGKMCVLLEVPQSQILKIVETSLEDRKQMLEGKFVYV